MVTQDKGPNSNTQPNGNNNVFLELTSRFEIEALQDMQKTSGVFVRQIAFTESRWMPLLKKKDIKKSIEKWSTSEIGPEIKLSKQKGSGRGYVLKGSIEIFKQLSMEIESM